MKVYSRVEVAIVNRTLLAVRAVIIAGLALVLLSPSAPAIASAAHPQSSPLWEACTRRLDGIKTKVDKTQRTVTIVNQRSRTYARVSFWVRTNSRCSLTRKFLTKKARIGYNGTVAGKDRKQGSGTTPLGTYTLTEAFGNGDPPPGVKLPYHKVVKGDYWVGDRKSAYYNNLRNSKDGGFRWSLPSSRKDASEKLRSFPHQYRYVVVINFNRAPEKTVPGHGFAIFLHVKSSGATGGCVGVTAGQMRTVMAYLMPGDKITIAR
jgi:L,D-peptidoglycan transpeptidase YkuD (ErfK/YbiS/YcfS/YnhG family)